MNYKQLFLLCISLLLGITNSFACMCEEGLDFFAVYENYSEESKRYTAILEGVKIGNDGHGMKVERIATLLGRETRDTITVWGDNGFLCRVNTQFFEIGDTLILNISRMDEGFLEGELENDYELSRCGWHYLRMKNKVITGHINHTETEMTIYEFKDLLQGFILSIENSEWPQSNLELQVFPNPASENVMLKSSYSGRTSILIYNALGQVVFRHVLESSTDVVNINTKKWTQGLYYVRFEIGHNQMIRQLVIL